MAKYKDKTTGQVIEVGIPELNPQLTQGKERVPDSTPYGYQNTAITSDVFNPPAETNFRNPNAPAVFPVKGINTDIYEPTKEEKDAIDLSNEIARLTGSLQGQSAFRAEEEGKQGLPDLLKTQRDLASRVKTLQNEAQAIPLQIQQESIGRGVTAGGIQSIQNARLRENAIQALTNASLLEQARGNVSTAYDLVDRAVAQKFDPIKEAIAVRKENLALIQNSPAFSLAEKKRAFQQQIAQDALIRQAEKDEADQKEIYGIGLTALKYGASPELVSRIQAAKTPEDAIAIAGTTLRDPKAQYEIDTARLDNILKQAQINKTNAEAKKTLSETKGSEASSSKYSSLKDKINTIEALKVSPGLKGSVGVYGAARFTPFTIDKAARNNFIASVSQLVSQETLGALLDLKTAGGTLGALSEGEREALKAAATKIGTWEIKDESGKVTGYEVDEDSFIKELERIQQLAQRAVNKAEGGYIQEDERQTLSSFLNQSNLGAGPFNAANFFNK